MHASSEGAAFGGCAPTLAAAREGDERKDPVEKKGGCC